MAVIKRAIAAFSDRHMRDVVNGTALAFALKVAGSALAFGFSVAVARLVGPDGAGLYFMALAIVSIASIVSRLGLDDALLRAVAVHQATGNWERLKGVHVTGMRAAVCLSALFSLAGFLGAGVIAGDVFGKPQLADPLKWMSLTILPFTVLCLKAECLKGLKHITAAMVTRGIGVPLIALILVWPLSKAADVTGVAWAYLAAVVVVSIFGSWAWWKVLNHRRVRAKPYRLNELWASCGPLFTVSLVNSALLPWAPLLLLAIWANAAEVGVFGAAVRLATIVSILLMTANTVIAPKFAELYATGNIDDLGATARKSALFLTLLSTPLFVILLIFRTPIMELFGSGFAVGGNLLAILLIGEFVNAISGSVGYLLIMSGNERRYRNITVRAATLQFIALVILAPELHAVGAAIAAMVGMVFLNLTSVVAAYEILGVLTIPGLSKMVPIRARTPR